jgi:GNAT superfamily N-acetyltransferase
VTALRWTAAGERVAELVAQRRAIYGGELGWLGDGGGGGHVDGHGHAQDGVAWDRYDRHSTALLVHDGGLLVASGRLTVEHDGPSELGDLVDWRAALPPELRAAPAAEWSRVMIAPTHRRGGLFRRMYEAVRACARDRGAVLLCGASVAQLRPLYASLGFTYLDVPFRSDFFERSPVYYPAYQRIA